MEICTFLNKDFLFIFSVCCFAINELLLKYILSLLFEINTVLNVTI